MGIVIDIVLILIILLSAFLGYKKGLVVLGAGLFAGIIAIILTLVLYRPISNAIIDNTQLDEKLAQVILEKGVNLIDTNKKDSSNEYVKAATDGVTDQIKNETLPAASQGLAVNIINILVPIALYFVLKIVLSIIIKLLDIVAKLPILKQFNEIGGIIYGLLRGAIIIIIMIALLNVYIKMNVNMDLEEKIQQTHITKFVYNKLGEVDVKNLF